MELVATQMSRWKGVELRASYFGPLRVRLLVGLFVVLVGLTAMIVVATALGIYL